MSHPINNNQPVGPSARRRRRWHRLVAAAVPLAALTAGYAGAQAASPTASKPTGDHADHKMRADDSPTVRSRS